MRSTSKKLTPRDFTYVNDEVLGQTYQNGPYTILIGNTSYAVTYQGQTFKWGLFSLLSAVQACARHEAQRQVNGWQIFETFKSDRAAEEEAVRRGLNK